MTITTTTQHLGQAARRARLVAPAGWRPVAAFVGCGGTRVAPVPSAVSCDETADTTNATTRTADAMVHGLMTIEPPARHLGTRST